MGMAASQARLLSITMRLTSNEFQSQMISNGKTRLANETQFASEEYMEALNATKLQYVYYDANGERSLYDLTASTLLFYQPLKNQYALVNRAGQTMVNHGDATTFQQAANRDEFLVLNNCATMTEKEIVDPEWLADWERRKPKEEDFTTQKEINSSTNELYEAFMREASGCYGGAQGGSNCFMHVLASMIGPGEHTSSDGNTFTVVSGGKWNWNSDKHPMPTVVAGVKDAKCCGAAGCPNAGKTVYQAAVDLLWESHTTYDGWDTSSPSATGGKAEQEYLDKFFHLIDHDLKQAKKEIITVFDEKGYNDALKKWEEEPPQMKTITDIEITDPDKAEWYNNLWYRMNGAYDDEQVMQSASDDDYNNHDVFHKKYFDKVAEEEQSWVEFDDTLINSSEWLKFALESGEITLEKVVFNEDYDTTTELVNKSWVATSWSSTTDIVEVEDDLAITKAEVKYNQAMREIQAKDKEYDNDIKKLDTEHNALQTEYDSIKSVMDKNMERSFKAFS